MSWTVRISKQALEDLDHLRAHQPGIYREAYEITRSIDEDPTAGIGAPANLPVLGPNVWCRNLSLEHRVVYELFDHTVVIAAYTTHID